MAVDDLEELLAAEQNAGNALERAAVLEVQRVAVGIGRAEELDVDDARRDGPLVGQ